VTQMTTDATPPGWGGWFRPGPRHAWTKLCEAPTYDEAWRLLMTFPEAGDKYVAPASADPTARPTTAGRVRQ
jgi:hypothetical protein